MTADTSERQPLLAHPNDGSSDINQQRSAAAITIQDDDDHLKSQQSQGSSDDEASRLAAIQAIPWYRRPSIAWLLPFVFLLAMILGISQAPTDQLIVKIVCKDHFKDSNIPALNANSWTTVANRTSHRNSSYYDDPCNAPEIQALAAVVMGRIRFLKYIIGLFTIGHLTSLSDKLGRKALIYMTLIPATLAQALIVYMAQPTTNLGLWILYVDSIFMGLLGAADCTPREGRSLYIGYVLVALSLGLTMGPVMGAYLIKMNGGDESSAVVISIITLCILTLYTLIVLPESLPQHVRFKNNEINAEDLESVKVQDVSILIRAKNFVVAILDPLLLFVPGRLDISADVNILPSKYTLVILVAAYGGIQFAMNGITITFIPYSNLVFQWTAVEDGYYNTLSGAATFVVFVGIFPALKKLYKVVVEKETSSDAETVVGSTPHTVRSEIESQQAIEEAFSQNTNDADAVRRRRAVWNDLSFFIFAAAVFMVSYLIVAVFETEAMLYLSCCLRALATIAVPSFMSLLTSYVPVHQTGKALGGISVMDSATLSISSLLYTTIFSKTSATMPSAIYFISAAFASLSVLGGIVAWMTYRRVQHNS
ncbi:hypothetical protein BGX28_005327 [Mortierella sp. GBA30]|nr:hypothetical protein BGX28_005327 [Mortierella sp. GBA30]